MEATKAIVFPHGKTDVNGKIAYKYIIAAVVVSDAPLNIISPTEAILMGDCRGNLREAVDNLQEYLPPYKLGEISQALIDISSMSPSELTKVK